MIEQPPVTERQPAVVPCRMIVGAAMRQCLHHAADVGEITARDRVPLAPDAGYAAHGPPVDLGWFRGLREAIGTERSPGRSG